MTFLDFLHFGVRERGNRSSVRAPFVCLAAVALALTGCAPVPERASREDSLTSGRITVVTPSELVPLIERERDAFVALYPEATIQVETGGSSEGVRRLYGATCDLAILTRELEPDERAAAVRGGLELEGYRFARDAVVVVVHPGNRVENMTLDDLRRIYSGEAKRWSDFGGDDAAIEPVVRTDAPDLNEAFVQQVMQGTSVEAPSHRAESDSQVVALVGNRPGAIGYVSLHWADRGARALRLAKLAGLPFWSPDLEAIHDAEYPMSRYMNLYVRSSGPPLANGFITFVTSREGQMIVHEHGLLPTAIPIRFVRRSPMQGSH
jgi:phosphate transport system substrate-binding protein